MLTAEIAREMATGMPHPNTEDNYEIELAFENIALAATVGSFSIETQYILSDEGKEIEKVFKSLNYKVERKTRNNSLYLKISW